LKLRDDDDDDDAYNTLHLSHQRSNIHQRYVVHHTYSIRINPYIHTTTAHLGTRSQCFVKKRSRSESYELGISNFPWSSEIIDPDATEDEMQGSIRRILDNVLERSNQKDISNIRVEKRSENNRRTAYTVRVENLATNTGSFTSTSPNVEVNYIQTAHPGLNVEPAIVSIGVRSADQTLERKIQVLTYPVEEEPRLGSPSKRIIRVTEDSHTYLSFSLLVSESNATICAVLSSANKDANASLEFQNQDNISILQSITEEEKEEVKICGSSHVIRDALSDVKYRAQTPDWTGADSVSVRVADSESTIYVVAEPVNDPPRFEDITTTTTTTSRYGGNEVRLVPQVRVVDPDASIIRVTVKQPSVGFVALNYATPYSGESFPVRVLDSDEDIVFESDVESVNKALRSLTYKPPSGSGDITETFVEIKVSDEFETNDVLNIAVEILASDNYLDVLNFASNDIIFVKEDDVVNLPRLYVENQGDDVILTVSTSHGLVSTNSSRNFQESFKISSELRDIDLVYRPESDFYGTDHVTVSTPSSTTSLTIIVTPVPDTPKLEEIEQATLSSRNVGCYDTNFTSIAYADTILAFDADEAYATSLYDVTVKCQEEDSVLVLLEESVHQISGNSTSILRFQCMLDMCNDAFRNSLAVLHSLDSSNTIVVEVTITDSVGLSDSVSLSLKSENVVKCQDSSSNIEQIVEIEDLEDILGAPPSTYNNNIDDNISEEEIVKNLSVPTIVFPNKRIEFLEGATIPFSILVGTDSSDGIVTVEVTSEPALVNFLVDQSEDSVEINQSNDLSFVRVSGLKGDVVEFMQRSVRIKNENNKYGIATIRVNVTAEDSLSNVETIRVVVESTNSPPSISSANQELLVQDTTAVTFDIEIKDSDVLINIEDDDDVVWSNNGHIRQREYSKLEIQVESFKGSLKSLFELSRLVTQNHERKLTFLASSVSDANAFARSVIYDYTHESHDDKDEVNWIVRDEFGQEDRVSIYLTLEPTTKTTTTTTIETIPSMIQNKIVANSNAPRLNINNTLQLQTQEDKATLIFQDTIEVTDDDDIVSHFPNVNEILISAQLGTIRLEESTRIPKMTWYYTSDGSLHMQGTCEALSETLASVTYIPPENYFGSDSIFFDLNDLSSDLDIITRTRTTYNVNVAITPIDDKPIILLPTQVTSLEDGALHHLYGTKIQDVDLHEDDALQVVLAAASGTIRLLNHPEISPNRRLVLTENLEQLNLYLDTIEYTGDEAFHGRDSITISVTSPHRNLDGTVSTSLTLSEINLEVDASRPRLEVSEEENVVLADLTKSIDISLEGLTDDGLVEIGTEITHLARLEVQLIRSSLQSGTFSLGHAERQVILPHDVSAEEMKQTLMQEMPEIGAIDVSRNVDSDSSNIWRITFFTSTGTGQHVPLLSTTLDDDRLTIQREIQGEGAPELFEIRVRPEVVNLVQVISTDAISGYLSGSFTLITNTGIETEAIDHAAVPSTRDELIVTPTTHEPGTGTGESMESRLQDIATEMAASSVHVTRSAVDARGGYVWRATFVGVPLNHNVEVFVGQNNLTDADDVTISTYVETPRSSSSEEVTWSEVQAVMVSSTTTAPVDGTFRLTLDLTTHGFRSATTSEIHHDAVASRDDEIEPFHDSTPVHNGAFESLQAKLEALTNLQAANLQVKVQRSTESFDGGFTWFVTFSGTDDISRPISLLRAASTSESHVMIRITKVQSDEIGGRFGFADSVFSDRCQDTNHNILTWNATSTDVRSAVQSVINVPVEVTSIDSTRWIVAVLEHSLGHDVADSIKFCMSQNPVRGATIGVKSLRSAALGIKARLGEDVGLDCTDSTFELKCRGHLLVIRSALETLHIARIDEDWHGRARIKVIASDIRGFTDTKTIAIQVLSSSPVFPTMEWSSKKELDVEEDSTTPIMFKISNSKSFPFGLVTLALSAQHGNVVHNDVSNIYRLEDLQHEIDSKGIVYSSPLHFNGQDTVTVSVSSYYEPENTVQRTLIVRVNSREDRSTIRVRNQACTSTLDTPIEIEEDTTWEFLNEIHIEDPDGTLSTMSLQLTLDDPAVAILNRRGHQEHSMIMSGNAESIRLFLSSIKFVPNSDWNGETSLTILVAPNVQCVIPIHVTPVEDVPVLDVLTSVPLRGLEDTALPLGQDKIIVVDRDMSSNLDVVVDIIARTGVFYLSPQTFPNVTVSSLICADHPQNWQSSRGLSCHDYESRGYCSDSSISPVGWNDEWKISDFADPSTNIDASSACCVCGGGRQDTSLVAFDAFENHAPHEVYFFFSLFVCLFSLSLSLSLSLVHTHTHTLPRASNNQLRLQYRYDGYIKTRLPRHIQISGPFQSVNLALAKHGVYHPALNWNSQVDSSFSSLSRNRYYPHLYNPDDLWERTSGPPSWWNSELHRGYDEVEFRVSRQNSSTFVSETLLVHVKPQKDIPTITFDGAVTLNDTVTPDQLSLAIESVPIIELQEDEEIWIQGLRVRDVDAMFENSGESLVRLDLEVSNGTISLIDAQTRFRHEPFIFEALGVSEIYEGKFFFFISLIPSNYIIPLRITTSGTGTNDIRMSFKSTVQDANALLSTLSFKGFKNYFGDASLKVTISEKDSIQIPFQINPVNDDPTIQVFSTVLPYTV